MDNDINDAIAMLDTDIDAARARFEAADAASIVAAIALDDARRDLDYLSNVRAAAVALKVALEGGAA
jgi:hypothetical protein